MSGILGGLFFAGVVAAALSGDGSWNDEVGKKFTSGTKYVLENGQKNADMVAGAVVDNANELKNDAREFSKSVQNELSGYTSEARNISERVCALNPKRLYDASRELMNTVK